MGQFSFKCKNCDKDVLHGGYDDGHLVHLYLLDDGKVIEEMEGTYDGYGRVHGGEWEMPWSDSDLTDEQRVDSRRSAIAPIKTICGLWLNDGRPQDGLAAVHVKCMDGTIPTTQSDGADNQGWDEPPADHPYGT